MSIMIAVRCNSKIAVAADSLWSARDDVSYRAQPKLFRQDNTIISVGPSCRYGTALRRQLLKLMGEHNDWFDLWPEYCLGQSENSSVQRLAGVAKAPILVVWHDRIFEVWASGGIFESANPVTATGCGTNIALGAATAYLERYRTAQTVATKAAEVACKLNALCSLPVICEVVNEE